MYKVINVKIGLEGNGANGKYTYGELIYQDKSAMTKRIHGKSEPYKVLKTLSPDDYVEISFDDTQYKNIKVLTKCDAPKQEAPAQTGSYNSNYKEDQKKKSNEIAKAVAFKGATDVVCALVNGKAIKDIDGLDVLIMNYTDTFFNYLTAEAKQTEVVNKDDEIPF